MQRRHQKVVEIAPAPNLDPAIRERMCADAVRFATEIGYRNAGTVEFLLDPAGNYVFIEMNPRIQVEHTVTEEVTDVDLVQAQRGSRPGRPWRTSGSRRTTWCCAALPCSAGSPPRTRQRVPAGHRQDHDVPLPGGAGVRVDGGTVYTGAEVSAHFDSMLAKLTCRGRTFEKAVEKARRAVAEFRIRGVSTNISFLQAVLEDPDFASGNITTSFIETHPHLMAARGKGDRGSKLLTYLADVTVNQPHGPAPVSVDPVTKLPIRLLEVPPRPAAAAAARGRAGGVRPPAAVADPVAVTDTTFRDAHQSLLATRVRTATCCRSPATSRGPRPSCGRWRRGAGALRRRAPLPVRGPVGALAALRQAVPNVCLQMLLRGRNTVGYTPYPTEVTNAFVQQAADAGIDVFGSSTRSTTSSRCARDRGGPGHRDDRGRGGALLHRRPVGPRTRRSTRSTTTSTSPSGSSTPARTCWRSRTWPGCCAPRPRGRW